MFNYLFLLNGFHIWDTDPHDSYPPGLPPQCLRFIWLPKMRTKRKGVPQNLPKFVHFTIIKPMVLMVLGIKSDQVL